jgi:hypothetical protein
MASEGPRISKQGAAGKQKHLTLTIPEKLGIIWRVEYGGSLREGMATYNTGYDTEKRRDQLQFFVV